MMAQDLIGLDLQTTSLANIKPSDLPGYVPPKLEISSLEAGKEFKSVETSMPSTN